VAGAYNQFTLSYEAALHRAVIILATRKYHMCASFW
jgi:hypothetical protein